MCQTTKNINKLHIGKIEFEDINNIAIKQQAGLRYCAPQGIVFVSGFFSQLIVKALKVLNVCTQYTLNYHALIVKYTSFVWRIFARCIKTEQF